MGRGALRIYLGAAPGVGKTFAMLQEATRRRERGADVVVGVVETHDRTQTAAQLEGLEVVPRRQVEYRGVTLWEMDVEAILRRAPDAVLVDELAHTNAPGSRHAKRWQDVEELLEAGIDVVSTVNIQHLESMNDVVEQITGVAQAEVVPDSIVRAAEQVHLVDQTPEALRRRLAHGNVYPADRVDAALDQYFRAGNLAALRELALMWVADRVDEGLQRYRDQHGISGTWDTRERVVVAITGAPGAGHVIRRAARIASRSRGELIGVHIRATDGLSARDDKALDAHRELLAAVGGRYREVGAGDVAEALIGFARTQNATQIVVGASARSRWEEISRGSVINDVVRAAGDIDVHVVTPDPVGAHAATHPTAVHATAHPSGPSVDARRGAAGSRWWFRGTSVFPRRRRTAGWLLGVFGPALLTLVLVQLRDGFDLPTNLLIFTLLVAFTAVVGGFPPAAVAALQSFLFANWFFTAPYYTWTVNEPRNILALVVFLTDAAIIGFFVSTGARRAVDARRVRGDAETLAALAGASGAGSDALELLVTQIRGVLGSSAVAVLTKDDPTDAVWTIEAASAEDAGSVPHSPAGAELSAALGDRAVLVATEPATVVDPQVFDAFCHHLAAAVDRHRLHVEAERADRLADANDLRTGLLAALSHDLRTPLGAIQAAASTLREPSVSEDPVLRAEFTDTILEHTARLHTLLTNLLDLSRVHADAVHPLLETVDLGDVVATALIGLDRRGHGVEIDIDLDTPFVLADPTLLDRALANVIDNALKWSPDGAVVRIDAARVGDDVALRVVDRGPGIPVGRRRDVTQPFQRVDDGGGVEGTGLGLAVATAFLSHMGGQLSLEDTPGGGTTATILLTVAPGAAEPVDADRTQVDS